MRHRSLRLPVRAARIGYLFAPLLIFWLALTGGRHAGVGLLAAAAAAAAAVATAPLPPGRVRLSARGSLCFLLLFLARSVQGGIDVAWRALHPRMPLEGGEGWRPLTLAAGPPRHLFTGTACLMPGTLICRDDGERVWVHSITPDPGRKLDQLEVAVKSTLPVADEDCTTIGTTIGDSH